MKKWRLLLCCLLLLILNFSRTAIPVQSQDTPPSSTLQARRQELADRIAEREQLLTAGDPVALVQVRNRITELELQLFDLDAALAESQASLDLARQFAGTSNATLLADTLNLAGDARIRHSDAEGAVTLLNEALTLSHALGHRHGEAQAHALLGGAQFELNDPASADNYNQALQIWRELNDKHAEAQTLAGQGLNYIVADQRIEAAATLQNAEAIWRSLNARTELANTLLYQGFLAIRLGQWESALAVLQEADTLLNEKDAEPYIAAGIATSFGEAYEAYGQLDTALTYYREALTRYRDGTHDKRATVDLSNKVGRVLAQQSQYVQAIAQIQQGLDLALETNNALTIGLCHEALGRVWLEAGSYVPARDEFTLAINYFSQRPDERVRARAQIYLADTEQLLGNLAQAGKTYQESLRFFKKTQDYTNEAALCFGLGRLAMRQGRFDDEAEKQLKRSIELTERLRQNAASPDLRSSFIASVHGRYEAYAEFLMTRNAKQPDQALAIRAFEMTEAGRARALLDSLRDVRELRHGSDQALLTEEKDLQTNEQMLVDERANLVSHGGGEAELAKNDRDLTKVRSDYEALQARINSNARFNHLGQPSPLKFEEIRQQLTDAQTSLLSYSLGAEKSFAWLITKDGLQSFELPGKETIESASKQLLDSLTAPAADDAERDRLQASIDEVSRLVLQPVADKLPTSRLIVVADGILQYVPFQILKSANGEPLISRLEIVETPSASVLALVRKQRANAQPSSKLLVGFGDAVFSPEYSPPGAGAPRVNEPAQTRSEQISKLNRLPQLFNAKRELLAIAELAGSDSAFFEEYNATRDNLLSLDLSQYRILHVVTHGLMNAQHPELSGLVLSLVDANRKPIAGFVSLADIYKLRAPELVVLSACFTALGKNQDGEGLIGVTRGFMYAGASGVVASLWQVDDRATAELMKRFYAHMLQGGLGPAAALRAAQMEIRSQPQWSSPYYWAGFTFQGDYDLSIHSVPSNGLRPYQRLIAGGPVFFLLLAVVSWWYLRRRASRASS